MLGSLLTLNQQHTITFAGPLPPHNPRERIEPDTPVVVYSLVPLAKSTGNGSQTPAARPAREGADDGDSRPRWFARRGSHRQEPARRRGLGTPRGRRHHRPRQEGDQDHRRAPAGDREPRPGAVREARLL